MSEVDEKLKLQMKTQSKAQIQIMLEEGRLTATDVIDILVFCSKENLISTKDPIYKDHNLLNKVDGEFIDDEMGICWGYLSLANRHGHDKALGIAIDILSALRSQK